MGGCGGVLVIEQQTIKHKLLHLQIQCSYTFVHLSVCWVCPQTKLKGSQEQQ